MGHRPGPNTDGLELAAGGIATDERGFVTTDEWQNTNVEGVYAVGDVTGRTALTPVAIAAGRRLADRLFGGDSEARKMGPPRGRLAQIGSSGLVQPHGQPYD